MSTSLWQNLAAHGIPAREAALFDDSIECIFVELIGDQLIQFDWETLHFDALHGCAEFYLAEMFLCKERVYKANDANLQSLEFTGRELNEHLPGKIFSPFTENIAVQFLRSLSATFIMTISFIDFNLLDSRKPGKPMFFSDLFGSQMTTIASRLTYESSESAINSKEKGTYQVLLSDYWRDWQRAARLANFDFDLLRMLNDARAVRFYELTKLKRILPPNQTEDNRIDARTANQLPISQKKSPVFKKLEIEYEQLAALMPLPRLTHKLDIEHQINQLIKPLRAAGYVKMFALKPDEQESIARRTKLVFRFSD